MWIYNKDFDKWEKSRDILNLDDFKYFQQEYDSYRFYSKCLSGASYVPLNDTNNIFDILSDYKPRTWYIGTTASAYSNSPIPSQYPNSINQSTSDEYYNKYNYEYGLTLKNLFTPERTIAESIDNFIYVDVATTSELLDLNDEVINRSIDDIRLKEGHRVLVKNQTTTVTLSNTVDPNTYFQGEYDIVEVIGTNIVYRYYNEDNGIYVYRNNLLIRETDLDDYEKCVRFSVVVKLGTSNRERQFHLSRLLNGYYPTTSLNQPLHFKDRKNWLIRNKVDYNNLFDINYYDVIKHGTQSYYFEGITYSIPERTISIGEFGVIINHQSGVSNIVRNKYKVNLRSIDQTEKYYWIVGDNGILLKVRKHDFDIERIQVDCKCPRKIVTTNLRSISFFNDLNGVAVGDINTILITEDGGISWDIHIIESFNAFYFNVVHYKDLNNFYIGGNNGVFIQFKRDVNGWKAYKRRISKFIDDEDEFLLVENINDIIPAEVNSWNPYYLFTTQSTAPNKDMLFITTNNNNIIIHDVDDSIPFHTDFMYLDFVNNNYTDIKSIERKQGTNQFFFTGFDQQNGDSGIFSFDLSYFPFIGIGSSFSNRIISTFSAVFESNLYANSMFDYNGVELIIAGNNSILKGSSYSATFSFSDLDQSFESKLKSRLLFLDYDVASKLNFFTDEGDYRLPSSIEFGLTASSGNYFEFTPIVHPAQSPSFLTQSEINWWNYWQDSDSTFEYYATFQEMTDSTKVLPSGEFSYSLNNQLTVTSITTSSSAIINLAPAILDDGHSRFSGIGLTSISAPSNTTYDLYIYDYLIVLKYTNNFSANVGDIIRIESDSLNSNFLINKIVTFGANNYAYMFSEFNESIIASLISSTSIIVKNLNKFSSLSNLEDKFNLHPISNGYQLTSTTQSVLIEPKFNNLTSYYNLATNILTNSGTYSMVYQDSFIKFGYKPTYNILDYLEYLNDNVITPKFFSNKEYLAMPIYNNVPVSTGSAPVNECYIDYNIDDNNKLAFGEGLQFEWNSLFINTFVNITLIDSQGSTYDTERLLVMKKYYDSQNNLYIVEFHKKMNYGNNPLTSVSIISRRTLLEISEDLELLNNIQRPYNIKEYTGGTTQSGQLWNVSYQTLEKNLNFKVNTDSYAKVLLSDYDTISSLSGVVYSDFKGDLAMNITQLESKKNIQILNTLSYLGNLQIVCSDKHNLSTGDSVVLTFNGGVGSSEDINNQYFGYRVVTYIDDYSFYVDIPYGTNVLVGNDSGTAVYVKRDPFLNYQPVDIIDVGVDKRGKIAVELDQDNTKLTGDIYSLIDVDYDNHRFRLIDNLNVETLALKYKWIYEAEITDAVIGEDENGLVWYKGNWECGRWFGGTWISGGWVSGDWYSGNWKSKMIKDNYLTIDIDSKKTDNRQSIWFSGRWFGGDWEDGTWVSGRWYGGIWNNGLWLDGIWNDGEWITGQFTGGIWVLGDWNSGVFGALNAPAYWLDGTWLSGDFENGMWFNGNFGSIDKESKFGTKSYNSRAAIWKSGNWINGSFHSRLNIDEDGNYDVADIHKYSIWYNGTWFNGDFYGGVAYNIDFKSGTWHGGILEDIAIIGMTGSTSSSENYFLIEGSNEFNTGQEIFLIDNQLGLTYSTLGSNSSPGSYKVLYSTEDLSNNTTKIYVDRYIPYNVTPSSNTGLRLVSKFRNCNWKSGVWTNGIYDKGLWEGGIWYNGVFNATWM